jgi:uncharacterized membrane protein YtjA (UPF0391 family)
MLRWAFMFFGIALFAAVFGFGGVALAAAGIAKAVFFLFLAFFFAALLGHVARRLPPDLP